MHDAASLGLILYLRHRVAEKAYLIIHRQMILNLLNVNKTQQKKDCVSRGSTFWEHDGLKLKSQRKYLFILIK